MIHVELMQQEDKAYYISVMLIYLHKLITLYFYSKAM